MAKRINIRGIECVLDSGTEKTVEYVLLEPMEFHGIQIFLENPLFGDELDLKIHAPDDSEIFDYSNNTKLSSKTNYIEIKVTEKDEPAEIPEGFKIKFIYKAIDANGRKCQVWFRFKK